MRVREITEEEDNVVCGYCGKTRRDHTFNYWDRHLRYTAEGRKIPWYEKRSQLLTEEEWETVEAAVGKRSIKELADEFGVTYGWLRLRIPKGMFSPGGRGGRIPISYTDKEDDFIRKWWKVNPVEWIHEQLGKDCGVETFRKHAEELGLPPYLVRFTKREDKYIRGWWGRISLDVIADILDRSKESIRTRAVRDLGLPTTKELRNPVRRLEWLANQS